jgi:membrane associated rhomboid family serine protease
VILSIAGWNNNQLQQHWMFNPYKIQRYGQYHRFITSGFIHSNTLHLLFNMLALFFFGGVIERIYQQAFGTMGLVYFLVTYIVGLVVSSVSTFFKYRHEPYYNSLGASGGVAAILFASILYRPTASICLYFALCIPAFILGVLYLLYSYFSGRRTSDKINHDAHLYGSLVGIVFTVLLRPVVLVEFFERIKAFNLYEFQFLTVSFSHFW